MCPSTDQHVPHHRSFRGRSWRRRDILGSHDFYCAYGASAHPTFDHKLHGRHGCNRLHRQSATKRALHNPVCLAVVLLHQPPPRWSNLSLCLSSSIFLSNQRFHRSHSSRRSRILTSPAYCFSSQPSYVFFLYCNRAGQSTPGMTTE